MRVSHTTHRCNSQHILAFYSTIEGHNNRITVSGGLVRVVGNGNTVHGANEHAEVTIEGDGNTVKCSVVTLKGNRITATCSKQGTLVGDFNQLIGEGTVVGEHSTKVGRVPAVPAKKNKRCPPSECTKYDEPFDSVKHGSAHMPCVICGTNAPNCIAVECGHMCVCVSCCAILDKRSPTLQCPICRTQVSKYIYAFFS